MSNLFQAASGVSRMEQLAMASSPLHRLTPLAKLITSFIYIITVISFPAHNISGMVPFIFYPAVLMAVSGTPYKTLFKRLLIALPFPLLGGLANLFLLPETVFYLGGFAVSQGLLSFISIILKTILCVFSVLILIASTPFTQICACLSALKLPKILCLQLAMTYRYLSVLISEAAAILTAYSLRSPKTNGVKIRDMGCLLGQLLLRSFDRAERIYQAMKCRGFEGIYHLRQNGGWQAADTLYTVLVTLAVIFLRFFNLSLFFGQITG